MNALTQKVLPVEEWRRAAALVQPSVPFDAVRNTVAAFRIGSHSHGTHVPPSDPNGIDDTDYMLIMIPPADSVLGMTKFEGVAKQEDGLDVVVYEWSKWLRLLLKQNPNVVGTLWLEPEDTWTDWQHNSQIGDLMFHRKKLITKAMHPSFIGYARAQLYKMTHHVHEGYMGEKRTRLVEQYGYDVKNAAHMIRLLRMACEALETGELLVRRPDAAELIDIKQGRWSLARVNETAELLFQRADEAVLKSAMPMHPDPDWVNSISVRGYLEHWEVEGAEFWPVNERA